ncbi:hypothetical protein CHS0354_018839 [Potamilus streckersoni]|uniref:Uncharacterized protein n=1 Tax=Potamilus streckersoni TaxID=2493646 RepID=A0AAE0SIK8_9BIVA|nr:hypothetical protein CHS0354_018839 [Potamilus streckersoni]
MEENRSSEPDPCIFSNHKNLTNDGGRSTRCGKIGTRCDHYIDTHWYRTPDATIASVCPDLLHCGVTYPVWMNVTLDKSALINVGTLPKKAEGIVNRTGCMVTGLSPNECCPVNTTNTISVKNCSTFFVYYLERRIGCDEGYCFGSSVIQGQNLNGHIPSTLFEDSPAP